VRKVIQVPKNDINQFNHIFLHFNDKNENVDRLINIFIETYSKDKMSFENFKISLENILQSEAVKNNDLSLVIKILKI
jgi:hypothetical protein